MPTCIHKSRSTESFCWPTRSDKCNWKLHHKQYTMTAFNNKEISTIIDYLSHGGVDTMSSMQMDTIDANEQNDWCFIKWFSETNKICKQKRSSRRRSFPTMSGRRGESSSICRRHSVYRVRDVFIEVMEREGYWWTALKKYYNIRKML